MGASPKMIDYLIVLGAVCGLCLLIAHHRWEEIRLFLLRQKLFAIRDQLWEAAREQEGFDDPGYIEARERLNVLISSVHRLSIPVLVYSVNRVPPAEQEIARSDLKPHIEVAYKEMGVAVFEYLILHTIMGVSLLAISFVLFVGNSTRELILKTIQRWIQSTGPVTTAHALNQ